MINDMKIRTITIAAIATMAITANSQNMDNPNNNTSLAPLERLTLTAEWDKTFPKSDKVDHKKVTFVNRYGISLAADITRPKKPPLPKRDFPQSP